MTCRQHNETLSSRDGNPLVLVSRSQRDDLMVAVPSCPVVVEPCHRSSYSCAKEQTIMRLHFGIGVDRTHFLREVGSLLGLCGERVREIERDAVRAIQEAIFAT